ncbi:MAG: aminotransferase class I/II-fold pyridoxal phosphate-dependent enzyme [Anaerolineaceae bacterium]|nr:aminotransferase class I/II-fold pyridoxal phosphate-dependent enzyme [Anaerolineaceae bacterium]
MNWIRESLRELREQGLWRQLREVASPPGPEIEVDGRRVLQFASNDYLSLAGDPRLAAASDEAARAGGTGSSAGRLLVGSHSYVGRLEEHLAEFKHTETALVLPAGYMANLALLTVLVGRGDAVFADRLCHASILDAVALSGARLVTYRHNDVASLEARLRKKTDYRRRLVVTESVFSMDGDIAPLAELAELARGRGAMFVVDEAHATGVFGPTGAGLAEERGLAAEDLTATVGTLSKALGGLGGFIAASGEVIDLVINRGRAFIFTTGIPPSQAAVAMAALEVVRDEPERRERLLASAASLRDRLAELGLDVGRSRSPIIPVVLGEADRAVAVSEKLWRQGLLVGHSSADRPSRHESFANQPDLRAHRPADRPPGGVPGGRHWVNRRVGTAGRGPTGRVHVAFVGGFFMRRGGLGCLPAHIVESRNMRRQRRMPPPSGLLTRSTRLYLQT